MPVAAPGHGGWVVLGESSSARLNLACGHHQPSNAVHCFGDEMVVRPYNAGCTLCRAHRPVPVSSALADHSHFRLSSTAPA